MHYKRIIYCSHATVSMEDPLNLSEILGAAASNNRRNEITGVLAFADGIFIHAIEGREHDVDELISRLRADPRHRDLKVIGVEFDKKRAFAVWVMETPKMRPNRSALLRKLVEEGCEGSYRKALKMMLELSDEYEDQRQRV